MIVAVTHNAPVGAATLAGAHASWNVTVKEEGFPPSWHLKHTEEFTEQLENIHSYSDNESENQSQRLRLT